MHPDAHISDAVSHSGIHVVAARRHCWSCDLPYGLPGSCLVSVVRFFGASQLVGSWGCRWMMV